MSDNQSEMSPAAAYGTITNASPADQQKMYSPSNMISTEKSPVSSAQNQLYEQLPKATAGMRYVLVSEQQASIPRSQQQQRIGVNQCYLCNGIAIQRCFWGTNSIGHCRNMMCLQHAESTVQGPPWGTYYYCQEHYQSYLATKNQKRGECLII